MKRVTGFLFAAIMGISLALSLSSEAFAARLGGGKSFGSRPSYSQPYRAPSGAGQQASPYQQPAYQAPAAARNQAARESFARRGGLMGMLGGLALGGLLGSMLFGGAFEHINFMDILLFGGIAFLLFKLFASRRPSSAGSTPAGQAYTPAGYGDSAASGPAAAARAGFDTDVLFRGGNRSVGQGGVNLGGGGAPAIPADFDASAFLGGAKAAYAHLQEAWDRGDLADLRALTTDKVFGELQEQLRGRSGTNRTELLRVDARLLDVRDVGDDREASVLFNVLLKESDEASAAEVSEVWHFTRSRSSAQPTWFLDGIQQTDA